MKRIGIFAVIFIICLLDRSLFAYDGKPPTVSILNPSPGTKATPSPVSLRQDTNDFKVQVQVWDDAPVSSVQIGYCEDAGSNDPETCSFVFTDLTLNSNYNCGSNCGIYETNLSLVAGKSYYLYARASSSDGLGSSRDQRVNVIPDNNPRYVYIKTLSQNTGTGTLLVRDFSSQLCIDCHNVSTHSSQSTDLDYQNWQVVCLECHTPHSTRNIFLIREQILTPRSGLRTVTLYNKTGDAPNSYVDSQAGSNTTGICQVCHTLTTGNGVARWRNTGNADAGHYQSPSTKRCTNCHSHTKGFGAACDICHGNPPPPLAQPPTGSQTPGAHQFHMTRGYTCSICHYGSVGTGTTHNNTTISLGFVDILGMYTGGSYDGQTAANYESTHPGTTVSNAGSKTCSNIYCHGGTMAPNGGLYTSPAWDAASGSYSCGNVPSGACHGASESNPPTRGSHVKHVNSTQTGMKLPCSTCHLNNNHVNGSLEWDFDETNDTRLAGALYRDSASGSVSPVPSISYGTCTNLYCHSDGRRDTSTRQYSTPQWGSTGTGCNFCHGTGNPAGAPDYPNGGPGSATANSHYAHVTDAAGNYVPSRCTWCHSTTTTDGITVSTPPHLNQTIDVVFASTYGGTYSLPGKTCSNVACHGTGADSVSPQWGGDAGCIDCHRATVLGNLRKVVGTGGDFVRPSRHVSNGTTTEVVTNFDCIVCHMEGDVTSTSSNIKIDKDYHPMEPVAQNIIHLRNVDNYTTGWAIDKTSWTTEMRNNMDRFCLSCHDSDDSANTNVTLTASGPGAASWTATGGTADYLNLLTNDGDNTYYRTTTNNAYHTNAIHDVSSSLTGTIDSVTVYGVCRGEAANNRMRLVLRISGTNYDGATEHTLTTSYATYSETWTTNPAGGSWTWAAINSMEAGFKSTAITTGQRCTQLYVVVSASGTNFDLGAGTQKLVWGPDLGGASTIAVNSTNNGLLLGTAVARRFTPFNTADNQQNAREVDTGIRNARLNSGVKDIRGQFNSKNIVGKGWASHHNLNIFQKRYSTRNTTAWPDAAWTTYTTKEGQNIRTAGETAGLHCSDCHLNEVNAHGSLNTFYMLSDSAGNDAAFTNVGTTSSTDICSKCHANTTYGEGNTSTASRTQSHNQNGARCNNISNADNKGLSTLGSTSEITAKSGNTDLTCLGCHGGITFGGIHGQNNAYQPGKTGAWVPTYRFMGTGGSMRWYSPDKATSPTDADWESATATPGCYTISADDSFGGCTQHGGFGSDKAVNRGRPLEY